LLSDANLALTDTLIRRNNPRADPRHGGQASPRKRRGMTVVWQVAEVREADSYRLLKKSS
jgi:hypothetical protein